MGYHDNEMKEGINATEVNAGGTVHPPVEVKSPEKVKLNM